MLWSQVFAAAIPVVSWKHYQEKYWPRILKMADLTNTPTSRLAAANIVAATVNEAAANYLVNDGLLHAFLSLCQDTETSIQKAMLNNYRVLLPIIKYPYAVAQLFSEVLSFPLSNNNQKKKNIVDNNFERNEHVSAVVGC